MDKYISQKDLDKIYKKDQKENGSGASENHSLHHGKKESRKSIFLCHSHRDKTIVAKARAFFNQLNVDLYIDWMDESMPEITNVSTATAIKNKIDKCHKFVFLATARALESKWCNWELGLAYAMKGPKDFAIFPIQSYTGRWNGAEYLDLYPLMEVDLDDLDNLDNTDLSIHYPAKQKARFLEWLNQ